MWFLVEAGLYVVLLCAIYWFLDWLVRMPVVGQLSERWILVTGCNGGFGQDIAKRLDRLGCHVIAGFHSQAGVRELQKLCSDRLITVTLDISKHESVLEVFQIVKSKLPPGKGLWGLINNAGVGGKCGQIEWLNLEDYQFTFAVNVLGTIDMTMTFLPLIKKERGRVVNVGSASGKCAMPKVVGYSISKHCFEAFSDALRRSLRRFDCRVCLIEPGSYNTKLTSKESYERSITAAWQQTTQEIRTEFGEEYLRELITRVFASRLGCVDYQSVVRACEHAMFSVLPRARYPVGLDARFLYIPSAYLPEWLSDWIFMDVLLKNFPIPASLKNHPQ